MRVHIVNIPEDWILDKIADKMTRIFNPNYEITKSNLPDYDADINYYVNWKVFSPNQEKSKCDGCWFTHFEESDFPKELDKKILGQMDFITAKSTHGKLELMKRNILEDRIHILWGIGVSQHLFYKQKVVLGVAGRPYPETGRKGEDLLIQLSKDLNPQIWKFTFKGDYWNDIANRIKDNGMEIDISNSDNFFYEIDYYLQTSRAEGGSMDILNAIYVGKPIISKDIGFIYDLKTNEDIIFKDYVDLLSQIKVIEESKEKKIEEIKKYTWDNFELYHDYLFSKFLDIHKEEK